MADTFNFVTTLSVLELAQALGLASPIERVTHSSGALVVLDSPALALRRHDRFLTLASEAGEPRLSLRRLKHPTTVVAAGPVRIPDAVRDIRDQPLRARLEKRMGDGRLVVVQHWQTHGLRHAYRNDDGKVECMLVAQQYIAFAPNGPSSPVFVELRAQRGYEHETASVARDLAQQLRLSIQDGDVLELLEELQVAAATSQCTDAPPLHRTAAATVLASWLLNHHTMMNALVTRGVALEADQLHALRVAMRHSRSLLRAYRDVLGRDVERHFQHEFRWLSTATSRLRDIDVLLAGVRAPAVDYATLTNRERERLLSFLERERARDARRLQGVLDASRYRRLRQTWPLVLAMAINQVPLVTPPIAALAAAAIGRALAQLRRDIIAVDAHYTPSAAHKLRKQCKRVRYLVAPCESLYPREQVAWAQSGLKQLQSVLGESCDRYAQLALFEGHLWRRAKGHPAIRAALRSARLVLRQRLTVSEVSFVLGALHEFEAGGYPATLESLLKMPDP